MGRWTGVAKDAGEPRTPRAWSRISWTAGYSPDGHGEPDCAGMSYSALCRPFGVPCQVVTRLPPSPLPSDAPPKGGTRSSSLRNQYWRIRTRRGPPRRPAGRSPASRCRPVGLSGTPPIGLGELMPAPSPPTRSGISRHHLTASNRDARAATGPLAQVGPPPRAFTVSPTPTSQLQQRSLIIGPAPDAPPPRRAPRATTSSWPWSFWFPWRC